MSKIRPFGCGECKLSGHICGSWCEASLRRREIRRTKELDPKYCYSKINKYKVSK